MGSLKSLSLPSAEIMVSATESFSVRGLSFSDISALVADHAGPLTMLFSSTVANLKDKSFSKEDVGLLAQSAMAGFPDLIHAIIATAADAPGETEKVSKLRVGTQIEALEQVVLLTLVSEAEVKKVIEIVTRGMVESKGLMQSLQLSRVGSGLSAAM